MRRVGDASKLTHHSFFFLSLHLSKSLIKRPNHDSTGAPRKKNHKKAPYNLPPNEISPKFASPFKERYYYRLVR